MEPADKLEITVGGQTVFVSDGQPFSSGGCEGQVRISPAKTLAVPSVTFDYPRHFAFEYDGSTEGLRQWTLDGNNVVLIITELDMVSELKDMEESMIERFGRENCKPRNSKVKLGGKELKGRHLDVTVVGESLTLELLELPWKEGATSMLFIQDSSTDSGEDSAERTACVELLDRTIKYSEAGK